MSSLKIADFHLTRLAQSVPGALKLLGDLETGCLRRRMEGIEPDRPVFITGLARAGTTILLNLFASLPNIGTQQYRDFPFVFIPYVWNKYRDCRAKPQEPFERAHKDRIKITKKSPEAFEEPIWRHFFPFVHETNARHVLTAQDDNPRFNTFYIEHLRKMLLIRRGKRYVSKGSYNITRLEYIANLLPDARFVVPVRHPLPHVNSLVRQHRLFSGYSIKEKRVAWFLKAAGHYEFGPQRVPINIDEKSPQRILQAWGNGRDDLGYAIMWRSVYTHARSIAQKGRVFGNRIKFVRYEDFCADPKTVLSSLFEFCELKDGVEKLLNSLPDISAPDSDLHCLTETQRDQVWQETAQTAGLFGYRKDRVRPGDEAHGKK